MGIEITNSAKVTTVLHVNLIPAIKEQMEIDSENIDYEFRVGIKLSGY